MKSLVNIGLDNVVTTRRQFDQALHEHFDSIAVSEDIILSDGRVFTWEYAEPIHLIQLSLDQSPELQNRYAETLRHHPNTREQPWAIVLGFDELVPGDKLSGITSKKIMCACFNFITLGTHTLTQACTWYAPCVIRSNTL